MEVEYVGELHGLKYLAETDVAFSFSHGFHDCLA